MRDGNAKIARRTAAGWPDEAPCSDFGSGIASEPSNTANSDDAWKILNLVVDWIKHAEAKAEATLAATGVGAGVLYNLVRPIMGRSTIFVVASGLCAVLLLVAGVTAGVALAPHVRLNSDHTSPLFSAHCIGAFKVLRLGGLRR